MSSSKERGDLDAPAVSRKKGGAKLSVETLMVKVAEKDPSNGCLGVRAERLHNNRDLQEIIRSPPKFVFNDSSIYSSSMSDFAASSSMRSHSPSGTRTFFIDNITPAGLHVRQERSAYELIQDIEYRAERRLPAPAYVPRIDELAPRQLTWDGRMTRGQQGRSAGNVQVNIIGCHHPLELILAKADDRSRKRQAIADVIAKENEKKTKKLNKMIKERMNKAEKHVDLMHQKQRQIAWLRVIAACKGVRAVHAFGKKSEAQKGKAKFNLAIVYVQRAMRRWYNTMILRRYTIGFRSAIKRSMMQFSICIRIWRKKKAVDKIKDFLEASKSNHQLKGVIHHFICSVKFVQRAMRESLRCKMARVEALSLLWERLDAQYIKKKLREREAVRQNSMTNKLASSGMGNMDAAMKIEMQKQAKRWNDIDVKMERSLQKHRLMGNLRVELNTESITNMMVPADIRIAALKKLIEAHRKEYLYCQQAKRSAIMAKRTEFSFEDVHSLIRGTENVIEKIINPDKAKKNSIPRDPFLLYIGLDRARNNLRLAAFTTSTAATQAAPVPGSIALASSGGNGGDAVASSLSGATVSNVSALGHANASGAGVGNAPNKSSGAQSQQARKGTQSWQAPRLTVKKIMDEVMEAHRELGTFKIKVSQEQKASGGSSRPEVSRKYARLRRMSQKLEQAQKKLEQSALQEGAIEYLLNDDVKNDTSDSTTAPPVLSKLPSSKHTIKHK